MVVFQYNLYNMVYKPFIKQCKGCHDYRNSVKRGTTQFIQHLQRSERHMQLLHNNKL